MTQNNLHISSAAITDKGLSEKRPQNEDSYLELRDSGFYAVADGVGGAQAGDVASQMAMEILGEAFINLQEGGDAEERLKLAIEQANSAIFQNVSRSRSAQYHGDDRCRTPRKRQQHCDNWTCW